MLQAISLDAKTLIIKADTEKDMTEIIDFISKKSKQESVDILLNFAANNRRIEKDYKFSRDECYGHIVAGAITAQCDYLTSEDMQDSRVINGVAIKNIFK